MLQTVIEEGPHPEAELLAPDAAVAPDSPLGVLRRVFGFPGFRGSQQAVIDHVVAGGDALVLMPTGGGKSICYQIPALCRPGTAVVVSPLIALMDDQVAAMRQLGVAAAALHSELPPEEARHVHRELVEQRLDLLYVSPERLFGNGLIEVLSRLELALFAIDEAHCVSQWGHEFRPEYRDLARLGELFPGVPRVALTATADPNTRKDILAALKMDTAEVFVASFHRPNLHLAAEPKVGETAQLLSFLGRHKGACGIVYCGSRARTERVAAKLVEKGFPAVPFHAGLDPWRNGNRAAVPLRRAAGGGGDDRLRHGDRPAGRAVRRAPGHAGQPRGVLPADRPRRPRRRPRRHAAAVRRSGRRPGAALAGAVGGSRGAETRDAAAPGGDGVADRNGRLPDPGAAGLLRRNLPAACGHCDNCDDPPSTSDATLDARKLLSAVYRTDQIFGAVHTIAVLRGEKTEAVLRHGHDRLSVFGIGADHAAPYWRAVVRQLIALGALDVDTQGHGGLFLVEDKARPILRGETGAAAADRAAQGGGGAARRAVRRRRPAGSARRCSTVALMARERGEVAGGPALCDLPRRHLARNRGGPSGESRGTRLRSRASVRRNCNDTVDRVLKLLG